MQAENITEPVSVLVVDDQRENRIAIKAILSSPRYRVLEAASEAEALRHLLREDCAVILLDVVMPGSDGFELATLIKQRPRTSAVPIIFLTAQAIDSGLIRRGYEVGAADYLVKPLLPEVVRAKVEVFAQIFRQRKQIERQSRQLLEAERKESELRLVELRLAGERRYRALAEAVPHVVWTAQPDGHVDYVNQRWFEYTGFPMPNGHGWEEAMHPDDYPGFDQQWQQAIVSGEPFAAACRLRRADGQYRWYLARALPEHGVSGEVTSWLGTFTDIDDQKRAEEVLIEFKGMLDAVADAVLIFDADDLRMHYVNQGASNLLGYGHDELMALAPSQVLGEVDELWLRTLFDGDGPATVETVYRRKDGSEVPVELSVQRVGSDRGRVVSIARDITDRKQIEAEREFLYSRALDAVQARDEFLSIASHELRTPLTSLHLQIAALLRAASRNAEAFSESRAAQIVDKLQIADRQVGRLAKLIDQLLDVSRLTSGQFQVDREELDLTAMVQDMVTRFADDAAKADCEVRVHAEGPAIGSWDRNRLDQVMVNLFTNALKFGAGKPIDIEIDGAGDQVRLTVRDHGIGIAPDAQERVFQRFERAASSRQFGGLGLGLYIAHRIVAAHGGCITVDSVPDEGAAFSVLLPRRKNLPQQSAAAEEGAAS